MAEAREMRIAIIRATHASAKALERMERTKRAMLTDPTSYSSNAYTRAQADYHRAQKVLRANGETA